MTASNTRTAIDTILAVTDFSEGAARALDRAARIAHERGADLHVAHAAALPTVIPAWGDPGGGAWVDAGALVDAAYETLEREADRIEAAVGDRPKPHVTTGTAHRGLAELAGQVDADLVVAGAAGAGFRPGRLLGSTAERLVRTLHAPVLLVRTPADQPYRRVMIATDFSGPALAAATIAGAVAAGAERLLVHVHEDLYAQLAGYAGKPEDRERHSRHAASAAMTALRGELARLESAGLHATGVVRDGIATQVLPEQVVENGADLLALGSHGRGGVERLLLGSVSTWLMVNVGCDVLVATQG